MIRLERLRKDLRISIERYRSVKNELKEAVEKHQHLAVEKQKLDEEVKQLKEQIKTLKLAQALNGSTDQSTRELKSEINRYIREIDKCLQLINRD